MRGITAAMFVLAALLAVVGRPAPSRAQDSPADRVAASLVYLKVTFKPTLGSQLGVTQTDQATGFLISEDGFILTSYHLLARVAETAGDNVTVTASLKSPDAAPLTAAIVNGAQVFDLLLLNVRSPPDETLKPLTLGHTDGLKVNDPVFTSGFSAKQPFSEPKWVSNKVGPDAIGYLWALTGSASSGLSGSPVYLASGEVVGVLKGDSAITAGNANPVAYMVPIEFANGLISNLLMRELQREVAVLRQQMGAAKAGEGAIAPRLAKVEASVQDISNVFEWTAKEETHGVIVLRYRKLVSGAPQIKSVLVTVYPYVDIVLDKSEFRDSAVVKDSTTKPRLVASNSERGGQIQVPEFGVNMGHKLDSAQEPIVVTRVEVIVVPTLDDASATTMEPVTLSVITSRFSNASGVQN